MERLEDRILLAADFGDAPDLGPGTGTGDYATLASSDGPSHKIDSTGSVLFLGAGVDDDSGTLQNTAANADDVDGALPDDEDGVFDPSDLLITIGTTPTVRLRATNNTENPATLFGWIDFNADGTFDNATERAQVIVPGETVNDIVSLDFGTVPDGFTGTTYARFRLSTDDLAANPTGAVGDGEVEDHVVSITAPSDGRPLRTVEINSSTANGPNLADSDFFGFSVTSLGDLDGDGVTDVAVGAPGDEEGGSRRGAVHVLLLNTDGSVKQSTEINTGTANGPDLANFDFFGSSVTSLGDLDGDGVTDIAVGAYGDNEGGGSRGAVHVLLLDADGSVKRTTEINSSTANGPDLANSDYFGRSVTSLGDLDGDGVVDLAVGARGDDEGGSGRGAVHVLLLNADGSVKGTKEISSSTADGPDLADSDSFGASVTSLGDLDGDGVTDIAIGAFGDDEGGSNRGAVHVLLLNANGSVKGTTEINSSTANGPDLGDGDRFGFAVTSLGDLDGDGVVDLAVGARGDDEGGSGRGAVHVLLLNADGSVKRTREINSSTANGPDLTNFDSFGTSVTSLGDLDGDGVVDLAVGAYGDDEGGDRRGTVHLLSLSPPTDYGDAPDTVAGTGSGDYQTLAANGGPSHAITRGLHLGARVDPDDGTLQNAVANADDVNGSTPDDEDGVFDVSDLAITTGTTPTVRLRVTNDTGSTATLSGWIDYDRNGVFDNATERATVTVPEGTTNGIVSLVFPTVPVGLTGITYARFRLSTDATALNAIGPASDGEVEDYTVSITAPGDGRPRRTREINSSTANGPDLANRDFFGTSVASLGDLDGDGVTDLAVGAVGDDEGGNGRGAVHVLLLNADGSVKQSTEINSSTAGGPDLADFDTFGTSVTSLGDLDGDGVTDIAVGAHRDSEGGGYRGAVHVLLLNTDGSVKRTTEINSSTANGPDLADDDFFGASVASLGDLDGDGVADIAVGADGDDDGGLTSGTVHVLLLNADGSVKRTTEINSSTANGLDLTNGDRFGTSVTSLGDLDGDGVTDIAVGADGDDEGGGNRGAVHVLLLNADGSVKQATEINSSSANGPDLADSDLFGASVTSLGDLDGDGVTDIAVGAEGDDEGGNRRGAVHVLLLNADGSVKRTTEIDSSSANGPDLADLDFFGASVASLGDLDGDGVAELAVGAFGDDEGGIYRGAVHVILLEPGRIVDNGDAGYTEFGAGWANSGLTGFSSTGTRFSTAAGAAVSWRPPGGLAAGWYRVQLWNVKHPSNTTNARVTIVHGDATETRGLSQRDAPNGFTTIGTFYFDGSGNEAVTLQNLAGGVLRADAIRFLDAAPPPTVTIDNGQPGYAEAGPGWATSGLAGSNGSSTRYSPSTGASVTYRPTTLTAGWYTLELFNVKHPSNTTNARVTITHAGGIETRTLEPRNAANGFLTLGRFYFDGSGNERIVLENLGGDILRADAVRFTATPPPGPGKVDNGQPGYSEFGGGWANSGLTGSDGSSTRFTSRVGAGATWRPDADLAAGWYTLDLYNVQHPSNTTNARITIKYAGNTTTRILDQRGTPTGYVSLGTYYFDGSGSEAVTLQSLEAGNLRADALRVRATPPPAPVTIDNGQPGYSEFGSWGDSGLTGQGGSSTRFTTQTGAGVTYRPANLVAGWYTLEVYNVMHPSNTTNARVTIKHNGNTVTQSLDQRNSPNGFITSGTFFFDGAGSEAITIQNLGGLLRADAVRLRSTQPPQAQTQQAAPGRIADSSAPSLSTGDLNSLIDDALAAWASVGVDPSAFADVRFAIGDLARNTLGTYANGLVTIDTNAAGHGWFVDTTPADDTEFTGGDSPAGFDLFTVLKHELGHHLGLADETDGDGSLLETMLDVGERRHITSAETDLLADRNLVDDLLYG